ncbi:MAG TPA: hypothetical protein VEV83_00780, partial [Parafilimonas sp.]|nr:hypothetical protein [Parafilimonas sp.]
RPVGDTAQSLTRLNSAFANAFNILEETDMPPTVAVREAVTSSNMTLKKLLSTWNEIKANQLRIVNDALNKAGYQPIK